MSEELQEFAPNAVEVMKALGLADTLPASATEIIGALSEIMRCDITDFTDEHGRFDPEKTAASGKSRLIKAVTVTESFGKGGSLTRRTHKIETYDKLKAIDQLRDIFSVKGGDRADQMFRLAKLAYKFQENAKAAGHELTFDQALAQVIEHFKKLSPDAPDQITG